MSEESPRVCVDCGGSGSLGKSTDGRLISCETCGGHEDALGTGIVGNSEIVFQELSALRSKCERLEKALTGLIPKCLNCQKPTAKYLDDEGWICSAKCHDELAGTDGGVITDADLTEDGDALAGIAALATPSVTEKCADGEHVFSVSPPWICLKCGDVAPKSQPSVTPTEGNEKEGEIMKKCFCFWKGFLGIICYYLIVAGFVGVKDAWGNRAWFSAERGQIIEARVAQIETDDPPFRGNVNPSFLFVITKDDRFTHHQGPDNVLIGRKFIYEDGGSVIEFGGEIMVKVYGPPEVVGKLPLGCFPP